MMITVKVNTKSELVENRERKSMLYLAICCCDDKLLSRAVVWNHTVVWNHREWRIKMAKKKKIDPRSIK